MNEFSEAIGVSEGSLLPQSEEVLSAMGQHPFGDIPEGLKSGVPTENSACLADAIALVWSAVEKGVFDPEGAAMCWAEASRILERKLGRLDDAWLCYGAALYMEPDYAPALCGIRRLARIGGADEFLFRVIDEQLQMGPEPSEEAALCNEKAACCIRGKRVDDALVELRESLGQEPEGLVASLMMLGVSTAATEDSDCASALETLMNRWATGEGASSVALGLALVEERLGRTDVALGRLVEMERHQSLTPAGLIAKARLAIAAKDMELALNTFAELCEKPLNEDMNHVLQRCYQVLTLLNEEQKNDQVVSSNHEDVADLALLNAYLFDQPNLETEHSLRLADALSEGPFRAALRVNAKSSNMVSNGEFDPSLYDQFINPTLGSRLVDAISESGSSAALVDFLKELRDSISPADNTWEIDVATAIALRGGVGETNGLAYLREHAKNEATAPLPSLVRLCDRDSSVLAELALAQAQEVEDDIEKSWIISWAGMHYEGIDKVRAGQLHDEALGLNPLCKLSLAYLVKQTGTSTGLGDAYEAAAREEDDVTQKVQLMANAAVFHLNAGRNEEAFIVLNEIIDEHPDQQDIIDAGIRLMKRTPPLAAMDSNISAIAKIGFEKTRAMMLASAIMMHDPATASELFEGAMLDDYNDPIPVEGVIQAQILAGRELDRLETLFALVKDAADDRDEGRILLRIAALDAHHGQGAGSYALSLKSILDKLPGYREALASLVLYSMEKTDREGLGTLLGQLAKSTDDNDDAIAFGVHAWDAELDDVDLLAFVANRKPGSLLHQAHLEARTKDVSTAISCLKNIGDQGPLVMRSRLADLLENGGDLHESFDVRKPLLSRQEVGFVDLFGAERFYTATENWTAVVENLKLQAQLSVHVPHKSEKLLQAALVAKDQMNDFVLGGDLCLEVMNIEPSNADAYITGRECADEIGNRELAVAFLRKRSESGLNDGERHMILSELASIEVEMGSDDDAVKRLLDIVAIRPNDHLNRRKLVKLYKSLSQWDDAIEHLVVVAKAAQDSESSEDVFFELGCLYMDHTDNIQMAERCLLKVVSINQKNYEAMERLSVIFGQNGAFEKRAKALEELVKLSKDPAVKAANMVLLADVMFTKMKKNREGETILKTVRQLQPNNAAAIELLSDIYQDQGDSMANRVLLDGSLLDQVGRVVESPHLVEPYVNVFKILVKMNKFDVAAIAAQAHSLAGGKDDDLFDKDSELAVNVHRAGEWDVGGRVGERSIEALLFFSNVPYGLCETMRSLENTFSKQFGIETKQLGLSRGDRLDKKHPIYSFLAEYAPSFGIKNVPVVYQGDGHSIRVASGSTNGIVVPRAFASISDKPVCRYVAAYALTIIKMGLCAATILPKDKLRLLIAALASLAVKEQSFEGVDKQELAAAVSSIRPHVSQKVMDHIHPFAFDCASVLEVDNFQKEILEIGRRAAFIASGSLDASLRALCLELGVERDSVLKIDGVGRMLRFVFSKNFLEIRRIMAI